MKIIKRILKSIGLLLPVIILLPSIALGAVGYGMDTVHNQPCIVWRTSMPVARETLSYNGKAFCTGGFEVNMRLVELEQAVDALKSENAQLRATQSQPQGGIATSPTPVYITAPDQGLLARIAVLEAKLNALENKTVSTAIAGCATRTTGFSTTTGQSCIGNKPAKK